MLKADIFAIGMMVLEFCTLQPSAECYDEENYSLVDKGKHGSMQSSRIVWSRWPNCTPPILPIALLRC